MVLGVKTGREVWGRRWIKIGFAKEQCFQFGVKELWRDGKGRGLSELTLLMLSCKFNSTAGHAEMLDGIK